MEYISYTLTGNYGEGKPVLLKTDDAKIQMVKVFVVSLLVMLFIWDKKAKYLHRWLFN